MAENPSFEPRKMLARPGVWGRDPSAKTVPATSLDQAGLVAWAVRQNVLACALNELKDFHGNSTADVADVAAVIGGSEGHMRRKVAGSAPASYAELMRWEWLVRRGMGSITPVTEDVADALGSPTIELSDVAAKTVTVAAWPLPKGNRKGGRDWQPPTP